MSTVILNISELPWSDGKRRNQAIFQTILDKSSLFRSGFYVNPPRSVPETFSLRARLDAHTETFKPKKFDENVFIFSPYYYLPFQYRSPMMRLSSRIYATHILRHFVKDDVFWLWINNAGYDVYYLIIELMKYSKFTVFDMSDDFTTYKLDNQSRYENNLKYLVGHSDVLVTVNDHVSRKFDHERKIVFGNSTNFEECQKSLRLEYINRPLFPKPHGKKYVGFIGGLNRGRVDEALLFRLVREFSSVEFVFVGWVNDDSLRKSLLSYPNTHLANPVSYEQLPNVIKTFDVAIVPHLINEHTHGNDLMKVLDYMACGVPIVTTNCSNVSKYSNLLYIAYDERQFIEYVRNILDGHLVHDAEKGQQCAKAMSWGNTVPSLMETLCEHYRQKYR